MFNFIKKLLPKKNFTTLRILHSDHNTFDCEGFQNLEHIVADFHIKGSIPKNKLHQLDAMLFSYKTNDSDYNFEGFINITDNWLKANGFKQLEFETQEIETY